MKKLMLAIVATLSILLVGCNNKPTPEAVNSATYVIGVSTALVANQLNTSDIERTAIIEVVKLVDAATPVSNTTFSVAWTPAADMYLTKLVNDGKLTESAKTKIMTVFTKSVETLEYVIYKRYPTVKPDVELATAATHGFCNGFLTVYSATNTKAMASGEKPIYDKEAYDHYKMLLKDIK